MDAETPVEIKSLNVTVSYLTLTLINVTDPLTEATDLQYSQNTQVVYLVQDFEHLVPAPAAPTTGGSAVVVSSQPVAAVVSEINAASTVAMGYGGALG